MWSGRGGAERAHTWSLEALRERVRDGVTACDLSLWCSGARAAAVTASDPVRWGGGGGTASNPAHNPGMGRGGGGGGELGGTAWV